MFRSPDDWDTSDWFEASERDALEDWSRASHKERAGDYAPALCPGCKDTLIVGSIRAVEGIFYCDACGTRRNEENALAARLRAKWRRDVMLDRDHQEALMEDARRSACTEKKTESQSSLSRTRWSGKNASRGQTGLS